MQISLPYSELILFKYISRSEIIRSYSSSIFHFLRNLHTVFHSGCTNLHSHQYALEFQFFHILIKLRIICLLSFLKIAILTGTMWCLILVLICFSLMISDVEHLFIYLLAICMSSLENMLFWSSAQCKIRLFVFMPLSCMNSLYGCPLVPVGDRFQEPPQVQNLRILKLLTVIPPYLWVLHLQK